MALAMKGNETMEQITAAVSWESLMSNVDPLLEEGYEITVARKEIKDVDGPTWVYQVTVTGHGHSIVGLGYPLTEAMSEAWQMTPEQEIPECQATASDRTCAEYRATLAEMGAAVAERAR